MIDFTGSYRDFYVKLYTLAYKGAPRQVPDEPYWETTEGQGRILAVLRLLNERAAPGERFGPHAEHPFTYGYWKKP